MGWLEVLGMGTVVVLILIVRHWMRYPGNRASMFGREYAGLRHDLARACRKLKDAERSSARRREVAAAKVRQAQRAHRESVANAEKRLQILRARTPGDRVTELGRVTVLEHALRVFEEDGPFDAEAGHRALRDGPSTRVWLTGLRVECVSAGLDQETHLVLRPEGERSILVRYLRSEYPEHLVRRFAQDVEDAVYRDRKSQKRRELDIADAEAKLVETRAATEVIDTAAAEQKQVETDEAANPEIPRARAAVEAQYDRWETICGKRPLL